MFEKISPPFSSCFSHSVTLGEVLILKWVGVIRKAHRRKSHSHFFILILQNHSAKSINPLATCIAGSEEWSQNHFCSSHSVFKSQAALSIWADCGLQIIRQTSHWWTVKPHDWNMLKVKDSNIAMLSLFVKAESDITFLFNEWMSRVNLKLSYI